MKIIKLFLITFISVALCACISRPYLAKQQYILQAGHPAFKIKAPLNANLSVEPALAAPPFDGNTFIYRTSNSHYISDFYNLFMTTPAIQVTSNLTEYLKALRLFTHTNTAELLLPATYHLKSQLIGLYANYVNDAAPKAVVEIQYILLQKGQIILSKTIKTQTRLAKKSTSALVTAWNKALTKNFNHLAKALVSHFYPNLTWPKHHKRKNHTLEHKKTKTTQSVEALPSKQTVTSKPAVDIEKQTVVPGQFLKLQSN